MSDESNSESSVEGAGERHVSASRSPSSKAKEKEKETDKGKGKPAPTSTGSRVVAKLSEERLARKRAADRHAQRVLRQKTRQRVEDLEQRIRELTSNPSPASALQAAKKRTAELQDELQRLRNAARTIEQEPPSMGLAQLQAYAASQQISGAPIYGPVEDIPQDIAPYAATSPYGIHATGYYSSQQLPHHIRSQLVPAPIHTNSSSASSPHHKTSVGHSPIPRRGSEDESVFSVEDESTALAWPRAVYPAPITFIKQPSVHIWELPLRVADPVTPVDYILTGIIKQQKELTVTGVSQAVAKGPNYPNLSVLVAPNAANTQVHPVARVLSDLLGRITYRTFVDKVGALLVMYPMYQWQIVSNYDNYAALPSFMIPVLAQRTTPHPVWLCALGWPKLREVCIMNQEKYCSEEFQFVVVQSLNCNWKYGIQAALRRTQGGFSVTKEFWDHVRNLDNWTLDEPFQSRYPELEKYCVFTKYPKVEETS